MKAWRLTAALAFNAHAYIADRQRNTASTRYAALNMTLWYTNLHAGHLWHRSPGGMAFRDCLYAQHARDRAASAWRVLIVISRDAHLP